MNRNSRQYFSIGPFFQHITGDLGTDFFYNRITNELTAHHGADMNINRYGFSPAVGIKFTPGAITFDFRLDLSLFVQKVSFEDVIDPIVVRHFTPERTRSHQEEGSVFQAFPIPAIRIGFIFDFAYLSEDKILTTMSSEKRTFLCITCEFKGADFLRAIHTLGHRAYLVTGEKTRNEAWPHDAIEEIYYMPESDGRLWNIDDLINGTAHLYRHHHIDRIISLDDYDVSKAALLREEFRSPGMGQTTARHFFDKLAMRMVAKDAGILIPGFTALYNNEEIHRFFGQSEGPWLVKPRMDAGALGIRKLHSEADFWEWEREAGDRRHKFLVEEFKPGDILHVDTLFMDYKLLFHRASEYLNPPFDIAHGGGIFQSHTLEKNTKDDKDLKKLNQQVLKAFGLKHGASHSEFIRNHRDGKFYFLETSARVGGAHLAEMVEAASGVNLWKEWAKIELAHLEGNAYQAPKTENGNAGIIVTLSKYEHIDYGQFQDDEIWWTLSKPYHVGMILKHEKRERILELLDKYAHRIRDEFAASVPLKE